MQLISPHSFAIAVWLLLSFTAPAALSRTEKAILDGTFSRAQENGCLHVSAFYYRVDCGYSADRKPLNKTGQPWPWVGPTINAVYYAPNHPESVPEYVPTIGDDRRAPWLIGTIEIDDRGSRSPGDDRISGEFLIGPTARNVVVRMDPASRRPVRVVESWERLTAVFPATPVNSAVQNSAGGFDYVIATKGFPARLCRHDSPEDCFPSASAAPVSAGAQAEGGWQQISTASLNRGTFLGGNAGATATATFTGYRCVASIAGNDCTTSPLVFGARSKPGLDNLLLHIATDNRAHIIAVIGFWTQEFRLDGGPQRLAVPAGEANSWFGGVMELRPRNMALDSKSTPVAQ